MKTRLMATATRTSSRHSRKETACACEKRSEYPCKKSRYALMLSSRGSKSPRIPYAVSVLADEGCERGHRLRRDSIFSQRMLAGGMIRSVAAAR